MLKLAGVSVADVAARADLSEGYVYKQLRGEEPMQYRVERACEHMISERKDEWYPAAASMIRLLHRWTVETEVREVLREDGWPGRRPLYD
jgi:AcrR family transcriptional regulator